MDIRAYIQSGIIEQYVLGLASAEESDELQSLRKEYPELNQAITNFEKTFEGVLTEEQIQPPAFIKTALEKEFFSKERSKTIIAPIAREKHSSASTIWKYLAAACVILLAISTMFNFYFYSGYKKSKEQYQALLTERNTLQANNTSYQQSLEMFQDTTMMRVEMKGLPGKEQNIATVLWNKKSREVYLYMKGMQQTPSGKQYQLWAIVDGKPVSAGIINNCVGLCKMEKIANAQAFAISLEKEGGSPAPTATAIYVMGKI